MYFASDYFEQLYEFAVQLDPGQGKAYVDNRTPRDSRPPAATITEPGEESPFRNRSVEENLDLLRAMRAGEFPDGARCCAPRSTWLSPNVKLRDPVMYRIRHAHHHRTGDKWCIYPMYDWAHGQSDAIEGSRTRCARSSSTTTGRSTTGSSTTSTCPVTGRTSRVRPAEPHLHGAEQAQAAAAGAGGAGVAAGTTRACRRCAACAAAASRRGDAGVLRAHRGRHANSDDRDRAAGVRRARRLNRTAPRRMAVLRPLKRRDQQLPRGERRVARRGEQSRGCRGRLRKVPFRGSSTSSRRLHGCPADEVFRLAPGQEVRLRYAYFLRCTGVVKGDGGEVVELRAPTTRRRPEATRPTAGRSRPRCTGCRPRTPSNARCASTTTCSVTRTPTPTTARIRWSSSIPGRVRS